MPELELLARAEHGLGESDRFTFREPAQERRHQPGAQLIVRQGTAHEAADECGDLGLAVLLAIALLGNEFGRTRSHSTMMTKDRRRVSPHHPPRVVPTLPDDCGCP